MGLALPRSKEYVSSTAIYQPVREEPPQSAIIDLMSIAPNGRHSISKKISFADWLGRGVDVWVWEIVKALVANLRSGSLQVSSVRSRGSQVKSFLSFLVEGRDAPLVLQPHDLKPVHISQFVAWLKVIQERKGYSRDTVRAVYQGSKAVILDVITKFDHPEESRKLFPLRVLPNGNYQDTENAPAYSETEQNRLAAALRSELSAYHHRRLALNSADVMCLYFLIVAMRTGGNTTPLLEMGRDSLRTGLLPGFMFITTQKHRTKRTVERAVGGHIEGGGKMDEHLLLPMDVVAILNRALEESELLLPDAPEAMRNRLWLYRSTAVQSLGKVCVINENQLRSGWKKIVVRRNLRADDGTALIINVPRLRKSLAKRAWRISDGDAISVATILGNSPNVADRHYLRIDEHIKSDAAKFLNTEFAIQLRKGGINRSVQSPTQQHLALPSLTPTGRCEDTRHGHRAPKDGVNHCDKFVYCISCPSFAVVGEVDDLWRLFSFKRYAEAELCADVLTNSISTSMQSMYREAVDSIEPFALRAFGAGLTRLGKAKAEGEIHPFWAAVMTQSRLRRGVTSRKLP